MQIEMYAERDLPLSPFNWSIARMAVITNNVRLSSLHPAPPTPHSALADGRLSYGRFFINTSLVHVDRFFLKSRMITDDTIRVWLFPGTLNYSWTTNNTQAWMAVWTAWVYIPENQHGSLCKRTHLNQSVFPLDRAPPYDPVLRQIFREVFSSSCLPMMLNIDSCAHSIHVTWFILKRLTSFVIGNE